VERWDYWSAAVQFVGTLLFNISTGSALIISLTADEANRWIWRPDLLGSAAFLFSSALAVLATTDTDKLWDPHARNWVSTWLNMAGSIAFGVSAIGAYIDPDNGSLRNATTANLGTFVGALCFLVAALLVLPPKPAEERVSR
jgi:hypothetical protein